MPGIFLQSLIVALTCQLFPAPQASVGGEAVTWTRVAYGTTIVLRPAGSEVPAAELATALPSPKVVRLHDYRSIAELVDASLGFRKPTAPQSPGDLADPID